MTEDTQQTSTPASREVQKESDGFLTKEGLASKTHFHFEEEVVVLPELGGGKLLLKGITVAERSSLTRQLPDDPADWKLLHTAMSLSRYVAKPEMSQDEWLEAIKPWPALALDRINKKVRKLIDVSEEDEAALAAEFPKSDNE